jgi:hypothetical protein
MDLIDFKEYLREEDKPRARRISRTAHLTPEQQDELNRARTAKQAAEYEEMNRIYKAGLRRRRGIWYKRSFRRGDTSDGDEG